MTHDAELDPAYAANLAELRGDVTHGLKTDGTFATVRIPALDNLLRVVDDLLQALADTRQQLDEAVDLNRSALKYQELRDERHRAVKAWHDEHKRAKAAEAERDEARQIARVLTPHATASTAALCRLKLGLDALPDWLTDDPQPDPGPTRQGHDTTTSERN